MVKTMTLAVLLTSTAAMAVGRTTEVLVGTSATRVPSTTLSFRGTLEVQNLGPNALWCGFSEATAISGRSRRIGSMETWSVNSHNATVWCVTSPAQVSGAATIASEVEG